MASVTGERLAAKHKHKRKHKQKLKFKVGVVGVVARRGVCMLVRSMDGESEERLAQKKEATCSIWSYCRSRARMINIGGTSGLVRTKVAC